MDNDFIEKNIDDPEDFLWSIVGKYNLDNYPSIDREDLFQEAWIKLEAVGASYDEEISEFSTHAYNLVDNRIKNILDKNARLSNREYNSPLAIDNKSSLPLVEKIPDEGGLSVENKARLETALDFLGQTEREILRLHSEGYTQQEISNKMDRGYSQQHISRVLERTIGQIKRKF